MNHVEDEPLKCDFDSLVSPAVAVTSSATPSNGMDDVGNQDGNWASRSSNINHSDLPQFGRGESLTSQCGEGTTSEVNLLVSAKSTRTEEEAFHNTGETMHCISEHSNSVSKSKKCRFCGKIFGKVSHCVRHERIHTGEKPFACEICNYKTNERNSLEKHIQNKHADHSKQGLRTPAGKKVKKNPIMLGRRTVSNPKECGFCQKIFSSQRSRERHERIHTGEKPFSCQVCEYKSNDQSALKRHIKHRHSRQSEKEPSNSASDQSNRDKELHKGTVPEPATFQELELGPMDTSGKLVGACSERPGQVKEVLKSSSYPITNVTQLRCGECTYKTLNKKNLKRHRLMNSHTGEQSVVTKGFKCEKCDFQTLHEGNMCTHSLIHTGNKRDVSEYGTNCSGDIKTHKRTKKHGEIQNAKNSFQCDICQYSSARRDHVERHKKTHTRKQSYQWRQHRLAHNKKGFRCDLCGKEFILIHSIRRHMRDVCGKKTSQHLREKSFTRRAPPEGKQTHQCDVCGKAFRQRRQLLAHKVLHGDPNPFECDKCSKTFRWRDSLREHYRLHTGEKLHHCDDCGKSFVNASKLDRHRQVHAGKNANTCQAEPMSPRQNTANRSLSDVTMEGRLEPEPMSPQPNTANRSSADGMMEAGLEPEPMSPQQNTANRSSADGMMEDGREPEPMSPQQNTANRSSADGTMEDVDATDQTEAPVSVSPHLPRQDVTGPSLQGSKTQMSVQRGMSKSCAHCGKKFATVKSRQNHERLHSSGKNLKCDKCEYKTEMASNLQRHMRCHTSASALYGCDMCDYRVNGKSNVIRHMQEHHKSVKCDQCGVFCSESSSKNHQCASNSNLVQLDKGLNQNQQTRTEVITHTCDVCRLAFADPSLLDKHKETHTVPKTLSCDVCEKTFTDLSLLDTHVCGITFAEIPQLDTHKKAHTVPKPFECDVCGITFAEISQLDTHKKTHTVPKPFECDVCGETFGQKSTIMDHFRSHNVKEPFECDKCNRVFSKQFTFVAHLETHVSRKCYKCEFCCKTFTKQSLLATHLHSHIAVVKNEEPDCIIID